MTKLDERGAHAADELRRELASLPLPEPTRLVRRARNTRVVTAAAAALVLGVGSLAVARAVDSSSSTRISTANQPPSAQHDPPLVEGPDPASTLLTSWGQIHVGYVFVYADGHVIWTPDAGVFLDADGRVTGTGPGVYTLERGPRPEYVSVERRLSARGVELVRTGKLNLKRFLVTQDVDRKGRITVQYGTIERKGLWAEPTARVWEPSHYAVCFLHPSGPLDATQGAAQLPAPAQALLHGTEQHIYDPHIGAPWSLSQAPPHECFKITDVEKTTLLQMLTQAGMSPQLGGVNHYMSVLAIYPHGQYVPWGG